MAISSADLQVNSILKDELLFYESHLFRESDCILRWRGRGGKTLRASGMMAPLPLREQLEAGKKSAVWRSDDDDFLRTVMPDLLLLPDVKCSETSRSLDRYSSTSERGLL